MNRKWNMLCIISRSTIVTYCVQ